MGLCQSEEQRQNEKLSKQLKSDFLEQKKIVRLLLLGASEGGKSTLLKQMRILHSDGYSAEDLRKTRPTVYSNVVVAVGILLEGMQQLEVAFADPGNQKSAKMVKEVLFRDNQHLPIDLDLLMALKAIWSDPAVQELLLPRSAEFQFFESAPYFLNSLDRIGAPDYVPTVQDILMLRVSTTGIVEVRFEVKKRIFNVFDVGGQRSERKKWIHCFDNVQAIIFVTAISEFDLVLHEDTHTNRMIESMRLFRSVCNSRYFFDTSMIMFLNKKDLFLEKIKKGKTITNVFKDYKGDNSYEQQVGFIKEKFASLNGNPNKTVYLHETCATDTNQIELILSSVFDLILTKLLRSYGIM